MAHDGRRRRDGGGAAAGLPSRRAVLGGLGGVLATSLPGLAANNTALVAAASDLRFALEEIVRRFAAEHGVAVRVSYGSSGQLSKMIEHGAGFELFMSADEELALRLVRLGLTDGEGQVYAVGRLAAVATRQAAVAVDGELSGIGAALRAGSIRRLAIANPEHAPYGARAAEALRRAGHWELAAPKLVLGENVSQAAQYVASGHAEAGIVAWSLVQTPALAEAVTAAQVREDWHTPLRQRMIVSRKAGPAARALMAYLGGEVARGILVKSGFAAP